MNLLFLKEKKLPFFDVLIPLVTDYTLIHFTCMFNLFLV